MMLRTRNAPAVRLIDYTPPPYVAERVFMNVMLDPIDTVVEVTTCFRPSATFTDAPPALFLDGDELTLESIQIDSTPLDPAAFTLSEIGLTLHNPPQQRFELTIRTRINPSENSKLMGLYRSNGVYCTQCEADGFRRISYFLDRPDVMATYRVRLEADKSECPILLANGNPVEVGELSGGRHFVVWEDPHPKPCYLFALVGGDLGAIHDQFKTMDGRDVTLGIYVERGNESQATYAMEALKACMRWDEEAFGRAYDLDVFNIVAVSDFNMGAMENKGLNIFNDKYVLASSDTATDMDYALIEAIIAHEYFHNWTGNRITCRDWFQLCLKEGLTVFRDQEFTSDMRSRSVKRIMDARELKARQFAEDAGPLAHPVRPSAYREINNLYTATVYEKGAEVIRMLKLIIGADAFAAGMTLYFNRHDGHAATIEQFLACFSESSRHDLASFSQWYNQAGTPTVTVERNYDQANRRLLLRLKQETAPTPGQQDKNPQVIPVAYGLVSPTAGQIGPSRLFVFDKATDVLTIDDVPPDAVPSVFRGFSAPVNVIADLTTDETLTLARFDSDPFNRWHCFQTLAMQQLKNLAVGFRQGLTLEPGPQIGTAIRSILADGMNDPAFTALAVTLPGELDIAREIAEDVDPDAVFLARRTLRRAIGKAVGEVALEVYAQATSSTEYSPDALSAGKRALRNAALDLAVAGGSTGAKVTAWEQFETANNMTDRFAALSILVHSNHEKREDALAEFELRHRETPLVMDKWFALQAGISESSTLDRVRKLMSHPRFSLSNPNRARSLIGNFAMANPTQFNRADGAGYAFVAEMVLKIDSLNPHVAARIMTAFRSWRTLEPARRGKAHDTLSQLAGHKDLSRDVRDIVDRSLS